MEDNVRVEELSSVEKKIFINVGSDTVNQKFNEFFDSIKKEAQIPGFRKGKAPTSILKKYFGNRAKSTISQMLVSEYYQKTLREHNLNPIGTPKIENSNGADYVGVFNPDNSYTIELEIEVLPKIEPVGYDDIKLNLPNDDIREMYDKKLEEIRHQYAEREQITDGKAESGDSVVIDFTGFIEDEQFNGGTSQGFNLELGTNSLIPGFEEQVIGMAPGDEQRIKVTFPEDYNASHLAGKDAEFEIKLHNIIRKKLANVDNDLALIMGFDNVKSMEESVKVEIKNAEKVNILRAAEEQIATHLVEQNPMELPDSLIVAEKGRILQQSQSVQLPPEVIRAQVEQAEFNLKKTIIFEAIYDKEEGLELTPEELNKFLDEQAMTNNMAKDDLVSNLYNSNQMESFVGILRVKKVVEYIMNKENKEDNE